MNYFRPFEEEQDPEELKLQQNRSRAEVVLPNEDKLVQAKSIILKEVKNHELLLQKQRSNQQLEKTEGQPEGSSSQQRRGSVPEKQGEDMIKQVVMMGFEYDVVQFAAVKVQYRSVEAIVDYLSKNE